MTVQVVEMDHDRQRVIRVISDPVEVYSAMRQGVTLMAVEDPNILRQTIGDVSVKEIYERNAFWRMAS